jgi:hypothetical protein
MAERVKLKAIDVNYALLSWVLPLRDRFFNQKVLIGDLGVGEIVSVLTLLLI